MFQVAENERRAAVSNIQQGQLFKTMMENTIRREPPRQWDGMIHSSKLDWDVEPQKQFEKHLKSYSFSSTYTRAGNLYHDDFQNIVSANFGAGHKEYRFNLYPNYYLQGTVDLIQPIQHVGNCLVEIKTTSKYHRDKQGGEKIWNRLMKNEEVGNAIVIDPVLDKLVPEIKERLYTNTKDHRPLSDHLTQMWTYVWAVSGTFRIDWAVLLYIARDTYEIVGEYWYPVAQSQEKVQRAFQNYMDVQQCLMNYYAQLKNGSITG